MMPDSSVFITIKGSKGEYQDLSAPYMDFAVGVARPKDLLIEYHISVRLEDFDPGASTKALPAEDLIGAVKCNVPTSYMHLTVGIVSSKDPLVVELGID